MKSIDIKINKTITWNNWWDTYKVWYPYFKRSKGGGFSINIPLIIFIAVF